MLEFEGLNYIAIIVGWIISCIIGAYWYSPAGFAKQWAKLTGVDIMKIPGPEATRILISVVISSLLQVFVLGLVLNSLGVASVVEGLLAGLVLWFGFTAATTVGVTLYQRLSWKFIFLNSAYFLVVMLINSVILSVW